VTVTQAAKDADADEADDEVGVIDGGAVDEPVVGPGGMVPAFIEPDFGVPAADEPDAPDDEEKAGEPGSGGSADTIGFDKRKG
jgi:hypothetical protein